MKKVYFIIFLLGLMSNCFAQKNDQLSQEINTIENGLIRNIQIKGDSIKEFNIRDRMEHYKVPGVSIAIVENGKIKWAKGYGYANTETGTKVDTNTLFQAGSISKPLAALSVLKLYENDSLELNRDVNYYLKNWQIPKYKFIESKKVTLEKLLTHTAGMTVHGFPGYKQTDKFPDIIDVLDGVLEKETIEMMLIKHKNNWGLGLSLRNEKDSLIFSHGGKNEGFTNDMVAFAYQGIAAIIMTNADNGGKLIAEVKNAISKYYNWPISKPRTIAVISLSDSVLNQFTGKYKLEGQNLIQKVQFKESRIFINNTPIGDLHLLPITSTKFIDVENGTVIEFIVDENVRGFRVNNSFHFVKM